MPEQRPSQRRPTHRSRSARRNESLVKRRLPYLLFGAGAIALIVGLIAVFALRGDDDGAAGNTDGTREYSAESLLPNLMDLGFREAERQADPVAERVGQDSWGAIYTGQAPIASVQVRATVLGSVSAAEAQFNTYATALRNPPEEFVGSGVAQIDETPMPVGGGAKSYVTEKPDGRGQFVWTDVYRFDRAVVIVQVLSQRSERVNEVRLQIAERIDAGTK